MALGIHLGGWATPDSTRADRRLGMAPGLQERGQRPLLPRSRTLSHLGHYRFASVRLVRNVDVFLRSDTLRSETLNYRIAAQAAVLSRDQVVVGPHGRLPVNPRLSLWGRRFLGGPVFDMAKTPVLVAYQHYALKRATRNDGGRRNGSPGGSTALGRGMVTGTVTVSIWAGGLCSGSTGPGPDADGDGHRHITGWTESPRPLDRGLPVALALAQMRTVTGTVT